MKPTLDDMRFEGKVNVLRALENQASESFMQKINRFLSREVEVPLAGLFAVGITGILLVAFPIQWHLKTLEDAPAPYTITVIKGESNHEIYY